MAVRRLLRSALATGAMSWALIAAANADRLDPVGGPRPPSTPQPTGSAATSPRAPASLDAPTEVPIEVVGHITLVQAAVNGAVRAMLIVDTGASTTLITPLLMARLGQPIPPHAPRREVSVGGGQTLQVPFVTIGVLQVGDARVDGIEVGVYDAFPEAPELDGWLGTDFLHRFRVTLDKKARRMTLAPLPR